MDLTHGTEQEKIGRAKKTMLWFAMISMIMTFAGLTSAYIVSMSRPDWVTDFIIPDALKWSTVVLLLSSATIHLAKKAIQKEDNKLGGILLVSTIVLGGFFIFLQFEGFNYLMDELKLHMSGSDVATSFLYILVGLHLAHLFCGMIVLLVVVYNHFKQRYSSGQTLGLELGVMFWHFLDFLWVYLFLFFYFVR